ncbi:MAG TPA: nuclear transport factor 2 family protein [Gaiella sp.]|jgi:predicted SnoaL-like aldol condensation-catalyzing enzyme
MKVRTVSRLLAGLAVVCLMLTLGVSFALADDDDGDRSGSRQSKACAHGGQLERNKRNVVAYYETAFNDKDPEKAVRLYGGDRYIQHNPLAANGFQAFIEFVNTFTGQFPDIHIDIRRVVAECDLVVTHGLLTGTPFGALGSKVVDIFRVDRRGKIVEHWDVLAAISPTSANGNPEV